MKRRAIPMAVAAAVLLLVIAYLWGPSSVPAGQERLVTLTNSNLSEFAAAFDADSKRVRVLVIWEPILATDWKAPSHSTLARIPDRRARQFWDPKHLALIIHDFAGEKRKGALKD